MKNGGKTPRISRWVQVLSLYTGHFNPVPIGWDVEAMNFFRC